MRYICCPNDPDHYATNLRVDGVTKNLIWDSARGQDVLIVQTAFGESASERLEAICGALSETNPPPGQYTEILPGVWIRPTSAADRAKHNGCEPHGPASRYTIFSCTRECNDTSRVYQTRDPAMITAYCDIPLELHVAVEKETRWEGFLRRREVETGFYRIRFPDSLDGGYRGGDLICQTGGLSLPVTPEMVAQKCVYVKTDTPPLILSRNKGLRLV